ncbi:MAG: MobA/MobL family protein, partial [Acetobacteraceae bacterium]|nr:MobA/MobL family protein [Acetobacteraceae bacterium]
CGITNCGSRNPFRALSEHFSKPVGFAACGPSAPGQGFEERSGRRHMAASWYRASIQSIGRSAGRSVCAAAAYRAGVLIHDERTGLTHDYRRKGGVVDSWTRLADHAPAVLADPARLWNAAEAAENRRNSMTARELEVSLPAAVDDATRREIADAVARFLVERYGVAAHVSIHRPHRRGSQRNHHAHILFTTRRVGRDGFGEKTRELDVKKTSAAEVEAIREAVAAIVNRALERAGLPERVDHRSYERQGLEREATQHMGHAASAMERRGETTRIGDHNRAVMERNAERERLQDQAKVIDLAIAREERRRQEQERRERQAAQARTVWRERMRFEAWANGVRATTQSRQLERKGEQDRAHAAQWDRLDAELSRQHGPGKLAAQSRLDAIRQRQERGGMWYRLTRARADRQQARALQKTLADIARREQEQRGKLAAQQAPEKRELAQAHERELQADERRIEAARERREAAGWTPLEPGREAEAQRQQDTGREAATGVASDYERRVRENIERITRQREAECERGDGGREREI